MDLKEIRGRGLAQERCSVAGPFEPGNESWCFIEGGEFFDPLSACQLLKTISAPWSCFFSSSINGTDGSGKCLNASRSVGEQAHEKLCDRWSRLILSVEHVFHCVGDD
jgi:hypothetical protein